MDKIETIIKDKLGTDIAKASNDKLFAALLDIVKEEAEKKAQTAGKKKLYYISAEFLIGKLLTNNLINLGLYDEVEKCLSRYGKSLAEIEDAENEPSLGNGGLGRLAACFLDSIATLGLNGDGVGLNYHLGLFRQVFEKNLQNEEPNPWITDKSWLTKTDVTYKIHFGGKSVVSRMYDIDVVGYGGHTTKLHLFDVDSVDEGIVKEGINFDKEDIGRNLTLFLYPDDSDEEGRILRVYQQYFMVSNAARLILDEAKERGSNLHDLADYATIQINDTHPSMVIPELIRLLQQRGMLLDEAIDIVSKTCAYTNHTILAEALEKWPMHYLQAAVPQLLPIIWELHNRIDKKYNDPKVAIIDKDKLVHMAHMDIHYGYSVNGVAYLHTEILKNKELNSFYKLYPEKFNNKTNGITFRRWILSCNPELSALITDLIGDGWKKDAAKLEDLKKYADDAGILGRLIAVKQKKKSDLAEYLKKTQGIEINSGSVYDIQIKRLHEYKRQQLNLLYVIDKYFEIKEGKRPIRPITVIFGAKAAPAYTIAKDIIHAILCMSEIIRNDHDVRTYLNVVMVENYNVTLAEKLIPAADIHQQISLASKEASGTSNMKFMLNGAVAIGTEDGANVEMHEFVGDDNIYIFGEDADTVIARYDRGDYVSKDYYKKDKRLAKAVDFLIGKEMMKVGCAENLKRLYNELLSKDWFMTFPDFAEYKKTRDAMYIDYEDRKNWARKMLINISMAGFFSSDRTIEQYNKEIWKL